MRHFRVTIGTAMGFVLVAGAGFAALRDPSVWWVGGLLVCLIGLLLTACLGAIYRSGRERAFWLGILVFGGGYLLLTRVVFTDAASSPVVFTNRVLDTLALNLRSGPQAEGEKVLADMNGEFRPASVLKIDRNSRNYFVRYDGWTDFHNAWVSPAQIKGQSGEEYHAVGNLLVVILLALIGSVVAVAFHESRERRRGERPSGALGENHDGIIADDLSTRR